MWYKQRLLFLRQTIKFDPIFWRYSRSRSRSFPGITTSHSRSRKLGMEFVIPIPVPKNWEWNLSFPFPFPKVGNAIFHSRSRSQNLGMGWAIPVPIPKVQKSFPLTPGLNWQCPNKLLNFCRGASLIPLIFRISAPKSLINHSRIMFDHSYQTSRIANSSCYC